MALVDTLSGKVTMDNSVTLDRTSGTAGNVNGADLLSHKLIQSLTNGSGTNQASGFFAATFTATTGGITISLADSADPLGAAGDDIPSSDPEGLKLRAIMVENQDSTNFISFKQGTNGEPSVITGSTDAIKISAGGAFIWTSPAGITAMSDGVDDEILIQADTASVTVKISYVYG